MNNHNFRFSEQIDKELVEIMCPTSWPFQSPCPFPCTLPQIDITDDRVKYITNQFIEHLTNEHNQNNKIEIEAKIGVLNVKTNNEISFDAAGWVN
jgi:hypothetical protein